MKKPSLRVSSGKFKRAQIPLARQHRNHQNSTTGRVKEAAFQIIRNRIDPDDPWIFYDLYAGSGQMGIEALSLGAAHATFVEIVPDRLGEIQKALASLEIDRDSYTLARAKAAKVFPEAFAHPGLQVVVWADPPYTYGGEAASDPAILVALFRSCKLETGQSPLLVIQVHEKNGALQPEFLAANPDITIYRYGSNCLLVL